MQESNTPDDATQSADAAPTESAPTMTQPDAPTPTEADAPTPNDVPTPVAAEAAPRGSGLAITTLVLGIVAFVFAFIPGLSFAAWLPAIGAIVFGVIALVRKSGKRGFTIAGLILGPLAWLVAIIVSVGALVGAAGSSISDGLSEGVSDGSGSTLEDVDDSTTEEAAAADSDLGTRANPAPAGSSVELGDFGATEWEVTFGETVLNANKLVANENQFNDAPEDGFQYILVPVTYTYVGDESGTPWIDVTIEFVSAAGTTHSTSDQFIVAPDSAYDINELYPGASATGNVVIMVPSDGVDAGTWSVSSWFSDSVFVKVV
ncbi:DUF4190 domain-containing protein [uncultured Schumannella sp.]|uniref:DUF4190 domain-containing protein n=1 Tax=uncultured Schumannella sp. TaxID=1195956 RepID=UPI0025FF7A21|nr:DUF4190 domain-containing protein [uncultured Schumannella sp.]